MTTQIKFPETWAGLPLTAKKQQNYNSPCSNQIGNAKRAHHKK